MHSWISFSFRVEKQRNDGENFVSTTVVCVDNWQLYIYHICFSAFYTLLKYIRTDEVYVLSCLV